MFVTISSILSPRKHWFRAAATLVVVLMGLTSDSSAWAQPHFTDVTAAAGINYLQHQSPGASDHQTFMSGGAAAGDFDNDGWTDLYVTRLDDTDILYRNMGNGTFQDVTAATFGSGHMADVQSNGVAWGDIDNDADLDLYVTSLHSNRYHLFINDGVGGFSEEALPRGAAVDGADAHFGFSATFADYDADGFLDLHTTEWRLDAQNPDGAPHNTRLLRNTGAANPGHFADVTVAAGVAVDDVVPRVSFVDSQSFASRFTDLDGDGHVDLAIASDHSTSRLFWNNGDGTFTDGTDAAQVGSDQYGMGSAVGDINGDGRLDWFVTSIYATNDPDRTGNRLYRNNGNRTFGDATDQSRVRDGAWGWGTAMFDYDNDGDLDIVQTTGQDFPFSNIDSGFQVTPMRLWRNRGSGIMDEVGTTAGMTDTGSGKGLLTFDFDRDGDVDVFVVNNAGPPVLYRNDVGNDSGWLRVETTGTLSNRQGIGAWITVDPDAAVDGDEMIREVDGGSHFLGQSEAAAHFGLGDGVASIDRVQIRWPGGRYQEYFDVLANSVLDAVEPLPADLDCDGDVDVDDADAMVMAVIDPAGYQAVHHVAATQNGDVDEDGDLDLDDINGFLAILTAPQAGSNQVVPEPTSLALMILGAVCGLTFGARRKRAIP